MKIYSFYGLGISFSNFLVNAVMFFLGFHTDPSKLSLANGISFAGSIALFAAFVVYGLKEKKSELGDNADFPYSKAFSTAFMITLFAAIGAVVANYVYVTLVNPDFINVMMQAQVAKWREAGINESQIAGMEAMAKKFSHPAFGAIMNFLSTLVFGVLVSLIVAGFMKRKSVGRNVDRAIS